MAECIGECRCGEKDNPNLYGFEDLINHGSYDFLDISSEEFRVYTFFEKGEAWDLVIVNPVALAISDSGHRILDNEGDSHFIPYGWRHLFWRVRPGEPHFVK